MARRRSQPQTTGGGSTPPPKDKRPRKGIWREVRELWDTLVLAFVLVTLMKTFVVDLYKIPSGSMTPTLIGDWIAWRDFDHDGDEDLLVFDPLPDGRFRARQVFVRGDDGVLRCGTDDHRTLWSRRDPVYFNVASVQQRFDRILVNKMWYWFAPLRRGDIVVFKLPWRENPRYPSGSGRMLFNPLTPFYIKRVAALEGEVPTISAVGDLIIDGEVITEPTIFEQNHYFSNHLDPARQRWIPLAYLGTQVPEGQFYVFGDNSGNSEDSRYWGGVEIDRLRGRAFFRYWPLRHVSFLR
jgi:signal peptidase I